MTAPKSLLTIDPHTRKRHAAERRFRRYGLAGIVISVAALALLLVSILHNGTSAFRQSYLTITLELPAEILDPTGARDRDAMARVTTLTYGPLLEQGLADTAGDLGLETGLSPRDMRQLISRQAAADLRYMVLDRPELVGTTIEFRALASGRIDGFLKGRVSRDSAERDGNISPEALDLAAQLAKAGRLGLRWNWAFITAPDASDQRPEAAGLGVAILGSVYMMLVVLVLALPLGTMASIYLEEFARKNRLTDLIEVNISNLAAVPSIVYGILGLAIFINFAGFNQSSPLVGGLVLTLMTLPRIIIPARAALKSVPPSIRDAALGVGASKMQSVLHHVLPLAMPGILTGVIIGLAQALGETAPLLLIGMVAFVRDYPAAWTPDSGLFGEASTALPVQVYNWTQRADPAFAERAMGTIIVLLALLLVVNAAAIILRRRFERRW